MPDSLKSYTLAISNCGCDPFIDEYQWKDQVVYLQSCRGSNCACGVAFYDVKGEKIKTEITYDQFKLESTFIKNAWTCNTAERGL